MPALRRLKRGPTAQKPLAAVRPNVGIEVAYQRRLDRLVTEMQDDVRRAVLATYRDNPPEIAQDASPAMEMRAAMRAMSKKWMKRFDEAAPRLGRYFADDTLARSDGALRAILKRAGFSVEYKLTPVMNDAYQAVIGEQVGLIRSIAQEHLSDVEGLVMRSVQKGGAVGDLRAELQERYGVTRRRAALIARDQNSKANTTLTRARQLDLGIERGRWMHSRGGKKPRPSHVAFSGKTFDLKKGAYLDGKWVLPGEEINCRCVWSPVVPGVE